MFELQILPSDSSEYRSFQTKFFSGEPISIIRFRCPSYHKSSAFNQEGYRGFLVFTPVMAYDPLRNDQLRLKNDFPITDLDKVDFYFKNCIKSWFCTCKNGQKVLSSCAHILSAIIGFGAPQNFRKVKYVPITPENF